MIVDVHAHLTPDEYLAIAKSREMGGSHQNRFTGHPDTTTLEERLQMMAGADVKRQVLSPTCTPYAADAGDAVRAARMINDRFADLCRAQPEAFSFWISLPLPHVDHALAEIERGFDELGGVGVVLGCFCLEHSIADERFDAVYSALDKRGATIFLHPCQNGVCSNHINDWGLTICTGASVEDSLAAMHLIARRIPSRFPRLRFIVPHFGGIMPMLLSRLDGQMPKAALPEPPSVTARRFYYDTVGWGSDAALQAAYMAFGAEQLVTGSDFPVLLAWESYKTTFDHIRKSDLPADAIACILGNAERLLNERR